LPQEGAINNEKKLQRRLLMIVVLAAFIPSFIVFIFNYYMVFNHMRDLLTRDQREETAQGAEQLSFFTGQLRNILESEREHLQGEGGGISTGRLESLKNLPRRFGIFRRVNLYDSAGQCIYSFSAYGEGDCVPGQKIPQARINELNTNSFSLGCEVEDTRFTSRVSIAIPLEKRPGTQAQFLETVLDGERFYRAMGSLSSRDGYKLLIIDENGAVIGRRDRNLDSGTALSLVEKGLPHGGNPYVFRDSLGERLVVTSAPVGGTSWHLVLERPAVIYFDEPLAYFKISLLIFFVILFVCSLGAYWLIKVQLEPFGKLNDGVEAISSGNLKYRLDIHTGDEIQMLADSFNRMVTGLEEQRNKTAVAMRELNKKKKEQEVSNKHLREASRLRSEFLANMSHELRTPLSTIVGYTSIMLDGVFGSLENKQKETIKKIYDQAFGLSRLINDVLDLSRIDAGKMPVFRERFRVSQVIKEILLQFRPRIEEKGLSVKLDVDPELEIESDRSKVKHVLEHLVGNAVKFTPQGGITISCEKSSGGEYLKISVMDTGIGMDRKSLNKIFDEFRQLDGSFTREYGGTGLGLALSKRLMKMLNAKITVKSKERQGSNFTLYLPLTDKPQDCATPARREDTPGENGNNGCPEPNGSGPRRVLAIDPDASFLEDLRDGVNGCGLKVEICRDGKEGFQKLLVEKPDLLVLCLDMPGFSGWDFLDRMKEKGLEGEIPVIAVAEGEFPREDAVRLEGRVLAVVKRDAGEEEVCLSSVLALMEEHAGVKGSVEAAI
jgi:signal transduction histidine kinase/CheY-like chemotaxis protein